MNVILDFHRKYRWPAHFFSVWSLGNPQKLLTTSQFLVSKIFFTIMNISFFSLRFDLFSIIAKEVNQIRNNVVCVVACFLVLLCTHYGPLQCFSTYFRKLKEIGVLWPIFPDVISYDYGYTVDLSYFQLIVCIFSTCHFWNHKSFFTTQLLCIFLAQTLHAFYKSANFQTSTAQVKFHQISHVIFQIKS